MAELEAPPGSRPGPLLPPVAGDAEADPEASAAGHLALHEQAKHQHEVLRQGPPGRWADASASRREVHPGAGGRRGRCLRRFPRGGGGPGGRRRPPPEGHHGGGRPAQARQVERQEGPAEAQEEGRLCGDNRALDLGPRPPLPPARPWSGRRARGRGGAAAERLLREPDGAGPPLERLGARRVQQAGRGHRQGQRRGDRCRHGPRSRHREEG